MGATRPFASAAGTARHQGGLHAFGRLAWRALRAVIAWIVSVNFTSAASPALTAAESGKALATSGASTTTCARVSGRLGRRATMPRRSPASEAAPMFASTGAPRRCPILDHLWLPARHTLPAVQRCRRRRVTIHERGYFRAAGGAASSSSTSTWQDAPALHQHARLWPRSSLSISMGEQLALLRHRACQSVCS